MEGLFDYIESGKGSEKAGKSHGERQSNVAQRLRYTGCRLAARHLIAAGLCAAGRTKALGGRSLGCRC